MSPTVGGVVTGHLAFRAAALMVSAVAHVLVYGALSLAPAGPPAPPAVLFVTDLIVTESAPPPVDPPPPRITPPRPLVKKPPKTPIEPAPTEPVAKAEPSVEPKTPEAAVVTAPPPTAAAEPAREVVEAPAVPTQPTTPMQVAAAPVAPSPTPPATSGPLPAASASPVTKSSQGGAAVIAALPPSMPTAPPGPLTRTAIPRGGYQVTPSYPSTARRLGIEGTALLRVFVDAEGRVGDVVVKQSAGHPDLDRAAADAVRRWRFEPARRGADTVAMWVELPVEFHLR